MKVEAERKWQREEVRTHQAPSFHLQGFECLPKILPYLLITRSVYYTTAPRWERNSNEAFANQTWRVSIRLQLCNIRRPQAQTLPESSSKSSKSAMLRDSFGLRVHGKPPQPTTPANRRCEARSSSATTACSKPQRICAISADFLRHHRLSRRPRHHCRCFLTTKALSPPQTRSRWSVRRFSSPVARPPGVHRRGIGGSLVPRQRAIGLAGPVGEGGVHGDSQPRRRRTKRRGGFFAGL